MKIVNGTHLSEIMSAPLQDARSCRIAFSPDGKMMAIYRQDMYLLRVYEF